LNAAIARFWVALVNRSARWSARTRDRLAAWLGDVLWLLVVRRRRIADTQFARLLSGYARAERSALTRRLFRRMARGVLDYGVLWNASRQGAAQDFVRVEGIEHLLERGQRPADHVGAALRRLDAGGIRIATEFKAVTIYARQSNPGLGPMPAARARTL
jgi:Kdo2-lipid IVA lauroyltransferase/acyltransferase